MHQTQRLVVAMQVLNEVFFSHHKPVLTKINTDEVENPRRTEIKHQQGKLSALVISEPHSAVKQVK